MLPRNSCRRTAFTQTIHRYLTERRRIPSYTSISHLQLLLLQRVPLESVSKLGLSPSCQTQFLPIRTLDTSKTPKVGDKRIAARVLASADLVEIAKQIQAIKAVQHGKAKPV